MTQSMEECQKPRLGFEDSSKAWYTVGGRFEI